MATMGYEGLSPKQEAFCREYVKDFNGTQAALRAGYAKSGAPTAASRLLTNDKVQARLSELTQKAAEKSELTVERVIKEYMAMAFTDISDVTDWDEGTATLIPKDKLGKDKLKGISELSFRTYLSDDGDIKDFKVKMHNKEKALEKLGKYLGMFQDKLELSGNLTIEDLVRQAKGESNE